MTQIYTVHIEAQALDQLATIGAHIAHRSTGHIAADFVNRVLDHAGDLNMYPNRGTQRDDIRPGLRTISYRKRVIIAFTVNENTHTVAILGFFYGGQDWETILSS